MTNTIQPVDPGAIASGAPLTEWTLIGFAFLWLLRNTIQHFAAGSTNDRDADRKLQWSLIQHLIKVNDRNSAHLHKALQLLSETRLEMRGQNEDVRQLITQVAQLIAQLESQGGEANG